MEQQEQIGTVTIGAHTFRVSRFNLGLLRRNRVAVETVSDMGNTVPSTAAIDAMVVIVHAAIVEAHRLDTKAAIAASAAVPATPITRDAFEEMLNELPMEQGLKEVASVTALILQRSGFEAKPAQPGETSSAAP